METISNTLQQQWEVLKTENPKLRIRDAAQQLQVSEAQLVALGTNNVWLKADFEGILKEVETLGYVMALTRNQHCVHERKGVYKNLSFNGTMGLAVNPDIDLRLFMPHWHFAFAVNEQERLSLQFFDNDGSAVHKIYLTDASHLKAYQKLVKKYKNESPAALAIRPTVASKVSEIPDSDVDIAGFKNAWLALKDTHQFFGMLHNFKVSRLQAMRLAPPNHAKEISLDAFKKIFKTLSNRAIPVMVFTASSGCIQIHTGTVIKIVETGFWFNVLDTEFNMHLNQTGISSIWVVKKPTDDGIVTGIEIFDNEGKTIVQFFGKRKPGIAESLAWRAVVETFSVGNRMVHG
jgi:putative hemin transport protein